MKVRLGQELLGTEGGEVATQMHACQQAAPEGPGVQLFTASPHALGWQLLQFVTANPDPTACPPVLRRRAPAAPAP
jgi:hypothetical protein